MVAHADECSFITNFTAWRTSWRHLGTQAQTVLAVSSMQHNGVVCTPWILRATGLDGAVPESRPLAQRSTTA